MVLPDPFAVLGLAPTASLAEVRAARRRLAQRLHPDHGGNDAGMRDLNDAFDQAVKVLRAREASSSARAATAPSPPAGAANQPPVRRPPPPRPPASRSSPPGQPRRVRIVERDEASFVVQARPPGAFAALVAAGRRLGDVLGAERPWWLEARIDTPSECWCRLELLPEGAATMVALTVAHIEGTPWPPPEVDAVRDTWIAALTSPLA